MSEIKGKFWWVTKSGTTVGIVVIQPEFGARKAYLGLGEGINEDDDARRIAMAEHIAEYGVPVYPQQLEEILLCLKGLR